MLKWKYNLEGKETTDEHRSHRPYPQRLASIDQPSRREYHLPDAATRAGLVAERIDPETLAYTLVEHAADVYGEDATDAYLMRVVAEVFAIAPGVLGHVVDKLTGDLKEEIARREDPRFSRATIALIETIEDEWRNRG